MIGALIITSLLAMFFAVCLHRQNHTLTALRSNCFIPDERGVKVRYSEASVARRVKAETPKEVG